MRCLGLARFVRLLLLFLAGLIPGVGFGVDIAENSHALILIQHDRAGPNLPTPDYYHAHWVRWPPAPREGDIGPLWSLVTGLDWRAGTLDFQFTPSLSRSKGSEPGKILWRSRGHATLLNRGILAARREALGSELTVQVMANPRGAVSGTTMMLGVPLETDILEPSKYLAAVPANSVTIYEARGWDDAVAVSRLISGRAVVVEYPPAPGTRWSRCWLFGPGWAEYVTTSTGQGSVARHPDSQVPGLIEAREVSQLLIRPDSFRWEPDATGVFGGANRWLEQGDDGARANRFVLFWLLAFALVIAFYLSINEDRGRGVSKVLGGLALAPAGMVVGGNLVRYGWISSSYVAITVGLLLCGSLYFVVEVCRKRWAPQSHPAWSLALTGWAALVSFDPAWSDLSGTFMPIAWRTSPEALGAFIAYTVGAICLCRHREGEGVWTSRTVAGLTLCCGFLGTRWWWSGDPGWLAIPVMALLLAEGRWIRSLWVVAAILPPVSLDALRYGFRVTPFGLNELKEARAVDIHRHAEFFLSGALWGTALISACFLLFGDRYLVYRIERMLRMDSRRRVLLAASVATAGFGLFRPEALHASIVVFLGAAILLFQDLLREAY